MTDPKSFDLFSDVKDWLAENHRVVLGVGLGIIAAGAAGAIGVAAFLMSRDPRFRDRVAGEKHPRWLH